MRDLLLSVCWLRRFKQFLRWKYLKNPTAPLTKWISVEEMEDAKEDVIEVAQRQVFLEAFRILHDHKELRSPEVLITREQLKKNATLKSLQSLNPFLAEGVLRVGGRLQNSNLHLESKHPIILPYRHPVTDLLIRDFHEREGHMGASQVLASINEKYWIIKGRSAVKGVIQSCLVCRFWSAVPTTQQMGNLPKDRVNGGKCFRQWARI